MSFPWITERERRKREREEDEARYIAMGAALKMRAGTMPRTMQDVLAEQRDRPLGIRPAIRERKEG